MYMQYCTSRTNITTQNIKQNKIQNVKLRVPQRFLAYLAMHKTTSAVTVTRFICIFPLLISIICLNLAFDVLFKKLDLKVNMTAAIGTCVCVLLRAVLLLGGCRTI